MILVVGLSPAIDVTYEVDKLIYGESLRVKKVHKVPGGKSVNVASVLKQNNKKVELLLPLGGESGKWLAKEISALGIHLHLVEISQETRTCVAVVDTDATVFNEAAASITESEFEKLLNQLNEIAAQYSVVVFSGSIPKSVSAENFSKLVAAASSKTKVVLDTSGEYLISGLAAGVEITKPNKKEILEATGASTLEEGISRLLSLGAKKVLVSMGEAGAELVSKDSRLFAKVSKVEGNATGAGDAMVAGLGMAIEGGLGDSEALRLAAAMGSAAVMEPVAGKASPENVARILPTIQISEAK